MIALRNFFISILKWQATVVIKKYKPKIIVITGSVGKTSTKDAIFSVLSQFHHVRKSDRNFNNDIGVPLTILGVPTGWRNPIRWLRNVMEGFWLIIWPAKYPEWLVLELGIRKPGDMKKLERWVKPDIVVVSAFGTMPSHVEFFDDQYGVWEEEASIIGALQGHGMLLLNHDDPEVMKLVEQYHVRTYTFGMNKEADLASSAPQFEYIDQKPKIVRGISFRIDYEGKSLPVFMDGLLGDSVVYTSSAALLVAHVLGLPMIQAIEGLQQGELPKGRMRILPGVKDTIVIDDTYNSSPAALSNALRTLERIDADGRKIAILGDMLDLGKFANEAHVECGKLAGKSTDLLVTVGLRAKSFAEGAQLAKLPKKRIQMFDDSREAGKFVEAIMQPGDVILVKGSQGIRMERAVAEIMAYPLEKEAVLVRQEPEWTGKDI